MKATELRIGNIVHRPLGEFEYHSKRKIPISGPADVEVERYLRNAILIFKGQNGRVPPTVILSKNK